MERQLNYFVKDESLHNSDEDFFRHQDLAENLRTMIDNTDAPFNVAIIGKWGLGKSSLINMVIEPMKKDSKHYIVQEINAWKYQKDELCRAFLKKLYQGVSGEKKQSTFEVIKKDFTDIISQEMDETQTKTKTAKDSWGRYKNFIIAALITLIGSVILFFAYSLLNTVYSVGWGNFNLCDYLVKSLLSYCRNIGSVFIIPLLIWMGKIYMDAFVAKNQKNVEVNFPLETKDDYEIYLENKIGKLIAERPDIKIVTVIDDLDRLSIDKIVEALDAIKTFMDFKQCVFIVPFDDNILKMAINKEKLEELNQDNENVIESELILDKLFQYKIYLPELIKIDIKEYASNLCKEKCTDFIKEYSDEIQIDKIIRNVLIHSNVKTPRQVKKILNVFINNVMIARKRENAGKVQNNFSTSDEGLRMIAKLSVLQADFNDFYDLLFIDANAIDKLLDIHNDEVTFVEEHLRKYCYAKDENYFIKKEYMPLVNYLSFTVKYRVSSVLPYLYMAQDNISVLTGDQKQQEFLAAVESNNEKSVQRMLTDTPELTLALKNAIEFSDDLNRVMIIITMSINAFESINEDYIETIANSIASRCEEVAHSVEDIRSEILNFENIFLFREFSGEPAAYDAIFKRCIVETGEEKCGIMIKTFLRQINVLVEDIKDLLENRILDYEKQESRTLDDFIFLLDDLPDDLTVKYLGLECFEGISKCIMDETSFDEKSLGWFEKAFRLLVSEDNVNMFKELWEDMAKYPALHKFINSLFTDKELPWLDKSISNNIVKTVRGIELDNYEEGSYEILSRFPFETNEDNSEEIDNLYSQILETEHFVLVARAFGKQYSLDYIPNTITKLVSSSFKDKAYLNDVEKLFNYFTNAQKSAFVKELISNIAYGANKDYENEKRLLRVLVKEKKIEEYAENICSTVSQQLSSYYNKANYFELAAYVIEEMCTSISESVFRKYLDNLLRCYDYFPLKFIKCFKNINQFMDDDYRIKIMKIIVENDDEQVVDDIADLINSNFSIYTTDNTNVSEPLIFFTQHFLDLSDKKSALDFVGKKYGRITKPSLVKLGRVVLSDKENIEYAIHKLGRFYNALSDIDFVQMFIDFYAEGYDIFDMEKLMFSNSRKVDDMFKIVVDNMDEWNKGQLDILMGSLSVFGRKVSWKNCYLFSKVYIDKNQDVEQNTKALKVLQMFESALGKAERKKYISLLYKIYGNSNSESLKKNVIKQVREIKGTRTFKSFLDEEEKEEFALLAK